MVLPLATPAGLNGFSSDGAPLASDLVGRRMVICAGTNYRAKPVQWPTLTTDVVASHMVRLINAPRSSLMLPPVQEDNIIAAELTRDVHNVLRTLTPREAKILIARFGLNGDEPQTLDEVSKHEAVTPSRVRQIEVKAFRKLRHPSRTRVLRPYITKAYGTTDNVQGTAKRKYRFK